MMHFCIILTVLISTTVDIIQSSEVQSHNAEFLKKQELIFQLLWHTKDVPKNHPEVFERIKNYKLEDVAAACENQTYAKEFEALLSDGILPRNQVFSPFREEHANEIKAVFDVFRDAKNFDDFAAMAAWSRFDVNELTWLHAFVMALVQRSDAKNLRLPNLHEILPHYFFNTDVVMQSYRIKAGESTDSDRNQYTIEANHTDVPFENEVEEYSLGYFREDVALNEFYFYYATSLPFWQNADDCGLQKNLRGQLYFQVHKTILNRYRLERLSLGLADIEDIDWEQPIFTGFHPSMTHFNGLLFPARQSESHVPAFKYKFLEKVKHYEARISKAIDLGDLRGVDSHKVDENPDLFNDFCNALEGNADSANAKFYGSLDRLYRRVLGFAPEYSSKNRAVPSALEMSLTSLRDPGFYRMYKRIVDYGLRFKKNLTPYKREELSFDGVRIDYVHVDKLVTYLSPFESTLNHPRIIRLTDDDQQSCEKSATVKVRQFRLDHKPFSYTIGVNSEKENKAIVRIFLGPRYDFHGNELNFLDSVDEFYELDRWIAEVKQGSNKLERSSRDSVYYVPEAAASDVQEQLISRAIRTSDEDLARQFVGHKFQLGLPGRLMLPRGTRAGLGLRLVVCLHAVESNHLTEGLSLFQKVPLDGRSLGFPFDRSVEESSLRRLKNIVVKDILVYYTGLKDKNGD